MTPTVARDRHFASRPISRLLHCLLCLLLLLPGACSRTGSGASTTSAGTADTADPSSVAQSPTEKRPNVLLIMADDLGLNDLAINNDNDAIDTPNLDRLAREGVRFTRHYASAVCAPARAALLTGQYPERLGYIPDSSGISPEVITLPERLAAEGYSTWHIGKWHLGHLQRAAWPDRQGFEHWLGFLNQWRLAGKVENGEILPARARYENPWLQGDSEPGRHFEGHLETILTDAAINAISEMNGKDRPWFLNLWYYAPHTPIRPAPEYASRYPDNDEGRYRAHVNQLDSNVGRLLAHLDTLGAAGNTIVVVVSDNGGTNQVLDNNAPFYGAKGGLEEGGLRTPLLIRWQKKEMNGEVIDHVVSIRDIYPTLLDALEIKPPEGLDGHSFYRSSQGLETPVQRPLFWELGVYGYGMLSATGEWRLRMIPSPDGSPPRTILYDLASDPTGATVLEPPAPALLAELVGPYESWYRDVHTVKTRLQKHGDGTATLTGTDFQRTPGQGGYSFGIGIPANSGGQLVEQAGVWSMRRSGNTVTARLGETVLSGDITTAAPCHSIVLTGMFHRRLSPIGRDLMDLEFYIDGTLQQSIARDGALDVVDPTVPTDIGDPDSPVPGFREPVILNVRLSDTTPIGPASFDRQLCGTR